jgi:hypothetical protein
MITVGHIIMACQSRENARFAMLCMLIIHVRGMVIMGASSGANEGVDIANSVQK